MALIHFRIRTVESSFLVGVICIKAKSKESDKLKAV